MPLDIVQHMLPTTSQWLEWSTRHPGWDELTTRTSDAILITGKDNTYARHLSQYLTLFASKLIVIICDNRYHF